MPVLSYKKEGLVIKRGGGEGTEKHIRDIQKDLRRLGYLKAGIDGKFGYLTELAVKSFQYDLLHNDGRSQKDSINAPVRVVDYNRGRVVAISGVVDQSLAGCVADILEDQNFPTLPKAENPRAENEKTRDSVKQLSFQIVPIPFLMAILQQESGLKHFNEPKKDDEDTYITVGLDRNANKKYIITSRGYGIGQYTLFHHPPRKKELEDFMLNIEMNLLKAAKELRYKYDFFINGNTTGTRADDRIAEYGYGPLRYCKYSAENPRYLKDCSQCMIDAGQQNIVEGDFVYKDSFIQFVPTDYYKKTSYQAVPIRKDVGCDWPYAARRYNGAGINSYHYQAIVLKNVLEL